jgi:multidrug efflux pump subunit AcrA (membrane-fusion protein)
MRTFHLLATLALAGVASTGIARAEALETTAASYREVDVTYATEAVVEATRQSTISAQTTGRIVELRFDVGDVVRQGEVIARIDPQQLEQALAGSVAQVAQARAAYENARVELERTRELARQKFVSQAALDAELASWAAMVVPVLRTTGINTKVYEALRLGLPLVITSAAISPFEVEATPNGSTAIIADDVHSFTAAVETLLTSATARARYALSDADFVSTRCIRSPKPLASDVSSCDIRLIAEACWAAISVSLSRRSS